CPRLTTSTKLHQLEFPAFYLILFILSVLESYLIITIIIII
uniref:Uncharacterized protein n=1 Tax=Amphimedon queenslandica TaxID=400682 RepID=A0A1X7SWJ7_AMPQE